MKDIEALIDAATGARSRAHAPYSGFKVGAALLAHDGRIFTGCNVENASYGLTICAERVALGRAIADGVKVRAFTNIAVVTDAKKLTPPCGACRQVIWELMGDVQVVLSNLQGETKTYTMRDLLPEPFDSSNL